MVRPAISRKIVVKLHDKEANATHETKDSDHPKWEQCFSIGVIDQPKNVAMEYSIGQSNTFDYKKDLDR